MRTTRIALMVSAAMLISGNVASGGSAAAIKVAIDNCQNPEVAPESRIEACSQLIHSNLVGHRFLARFYFSRAIAYEAAQQSDRALQDYDKALELDPNFTEAQANRSRLKQERPDAAPSEAK